jgi:hypothetical protein
MSWANEETIPLIRHLAGQGKSGQFIAHEVDAPSRQAVIAFCRRRGIKLLGRSGFAPKKRPEATPKPPKEIFILKRKANPQYAPPPEVIPHVTVSLTELRPDQCRWIYGDGRLFQCCGIKVTTGSPYCPDHHRRAYQ